jgi:hypothetical protein
MVISFMREKLNLSGFLLGAVGALYVVLASNAQALEVTVRISDRVAPPIDDQLANLQTKVTKARLVESAPTHTEARTSRALEPAPTDTSGPAQLLSRLLQVGGVGGASQSAGHPACSLGFVVVRVAAR